MLETDLDPITDVQIRQRISISVEGETDAHIH